MSSGMYINNNLSALGTQRNLGITNRHMSKSLERLSSGYRINVAADDPSGLNISEQLRTQQSGMSRAIQNSQEAANVIGIAEGALIELSNILSKMRQLAIHAANEGATSPDQVSADQSEVDSGIQTIDRIANTTRYSDQYLLNGSKGLVYNAQTVVNDSMDNSLVNIDNSRLDQVFKRSNSALSLSFTGYNSPTEQSQALWDRQARRGILEADKTAARQYGGWDADINNGYVIGDQRFILTGPSGSRSFGFMNGTHLGTIANSINNVKDSLGIGATLTFDSSVTGVNIDQDRTVGTVRAEGQPMMYNLDDTGAAQTAGVSAIDFNTAGTGFQANALVPGKNLDGDGRMYVFWTSQTEYIAYKDSAMTMEVGRGAAGAEMTSSNNSGISGACLTLDTAGTITEGDTTVLQFGQTFELHSDTHGSYAQCGMNLTEMAPLETDFGLTLTSASTACSSISGIRLGDNTDTDGKLFFKAQYQTTGTSSIVTFSCYKSPEMDAEDLVASGSTDIFGLAPGAAYEVNMVEADPDADGEGTGIFGTFVFNQNPPSSTIASGTLEFDQLGLRLFTDDYGSDEYVRLQNVEGNLFGNYKNPGSLDLGRIDEGMTVQVHGGDAEISVNGQLLKTDGLTANITTQDYSGDITFNEGELGMTTIAQAGQDIGALLSRGGSFQAVESDIGVNDPDDIAYTTWATNARHATTENLTDFVGGMQYQLGEGDNDIERTIYSIPSMAAANIGKITIDGKLYTLQDVLSGGAASLKNDPVKAMKIIGAAVEDVASTRSRLGAFQKDMLQTNINSLEITVENITKTESYIRDTNMATESTEFTKNQILVNAGTSMLAQANQQPQNVLQLLGGQ